MMSRRYCLHSPETSREKCNKKCKLHDMTYIVKSSPRLCQRENALRSLNIKVSSSNTTTTGHQHMCTAGYSSECISRKLCYPEPTPQFAPSQMVVFTNKISGCLISPSLLIISSRASLDRTTCAAVLRLASTILNLLEMCVLIVCQCYLFLRVGTLMWMSRFLQRNIAPRIWLRLN